jgi:hypothetical protein
MVFRYHGFVRRTFFFVTFFFATRGGAPIGSSRAGISTLKRCAKNVYFNAVSPLNSVVHVH